MVNIMRKSTTVLLVMILFTGSLLSLGISITPGASLTFVRDFGMEGDLPPLEIINVNESPMIYSIKVLAQSKLKGYFPVPDIEWVRLGMDEITVQPYDTAEVPIYVTIPDDPANHNRAWSVVVSVSQKPLNDSGGSFAAIELGAQASWFIETKSMPNSLSDKIDEPLVVSPSIWTGKFAEGEEPSGELAFEIMNNSDETHTYTFMNYHPAYGNELEGQKLDILPLIGDDESWISDRNWIEMKKKGFLFFKSIPKATLASGESAEFMVTVDVPTEALGEKVYESLVFIKVDGGLKNGRFVRFMIR